MVRGFLPTGRTLQAWLSKWLDFRASVSSALTPSALPHPEHTPYNVAVSFNPIHPTIKGRGAAANPANRFDKIDFEPDGDYLDLDEQVPPQTVYIRDAARSIIAQNDSPDVGFTHSINPYRGCAHGCIYCYARPTHEYFGLSAGLDFETQIFVKEQAPELLRAELSAKKWQPTTLSISGVTDCYQPIERKLRLTRSCIEVLAEFGNPVGVITKNHGVTRDIDVLAPMARKRQAVVMLSVTTLNADLASKMEPRTSAPRRRLDAIKMLTSAGIPVGVMVAPIIPGLTDHEMPKILEAAAEAGAKFAGWVPIRLPMAVAPLFENWLERHYPDRKQKVLGRIREIRGGKLNESEFGKRMRGEGEYAAHLRGMFKLAIRRYGLDKPIPEMSVAGFRVPPSARSQLELFG
jgi:DNA repair photolyase